jgi:hypothetical protein
MKKGFIVAVLLFFFALPAFAEGIGVDQTGTFTIGGTDSTDTMTSGLSSNVHAYYNTDGVSGTAAQWYVIGTYHLGGTEVYATAQDITALYKLSAGKEPGSTLSSWSGLPTDSSTSNIWSGDVWEKL